MAGRTNIEWSEVTWNPTTGCNKVSEGCKFCYAEKWSRMQQMRGIKQYKLGFKFKPAGERLNDPYKWKKPQLVFVNSMSDLFHENISQNYLEQIFNVMNSTPWHIYQILTKRPERVIEFHSNLQWTDNIWLGVSVENNQTKYRIDSLKSIQAKNKFISFEPLIEKIIDIDLSLIDWVIVGGESGAKARRIDYDWIRSIQQKCSKASIPFFFKQWGKREFNPDSSDPTIRRDNKNYSRGGCLLNGKLYRKMPLFNGLAN